MDAHQDAINRTKALEALSPYLESPRQTVIRNEAFVAVGAAMLFLQFMLGPWRRRSSHWLVQVTLWVAYTLNFPLITYTLGQMVTSPVKSMLYPVWAVILSWAAGCANAFMAYNIEDNKRWKRYLFELLQYYVYLLVTFRLLRSPSGSVSSQPIVLPLTVLTPMVFAANVFRVLAGWRVMNSIPSKLLADYMRAQVQVNIGSRGAAQERNFTMSGCKYLVWISSLGSIRQEDDVITIEAIWGMTFDDDSLLKKQVRDECLSFALSHLLRRRYFEMDCAEAGLPKTRKFALEGLLPEEDQANHYSRAFHAIEVELGFLYDFFFTKHAAVFSLEIPFLILVILKLICASISGVFLIVYPPILNTLDPIIEVGTRRVDVNVTVVIMGCLLLFEVLQAIHYLTSDWATVSLACSYITKERDASRLIPSNIQPIIRFLRRFKFASCLGRRIISFGYWKNNMGQSSVIGGNLFVNWLYVDPEEGIMLARAIVHPVYTFIYPIMFSRKTFVAVPDLVKSNIVSCLRIYGNTGGPLTNGEAALERNGVLEEFFSTLGNGSQQVAVMLIWHIATECCNIASFDGAEEGSHSGAQQAATTLSKYCAYLMYFVPELLAENSTDTLFIVHDVLKKIQRALGDDKPTLDRLMRVIQDSATDNNEDGIFIKGLKLGRKLEAKDVNLRWKIMAEFWAETIIYIAPSDKAAEHMERLAQGGEFLTHVWALLTHAGILKRDHMMPTPDQTTTPEDRV